MQYNAKSDKRVRFFTVLHDAIDGVKWEQILELRDSNKQRDSVVICDARFFLYIAPYKTEPFAEKNQFLFATVLSLNAFLWRAIHGGGRIQPIVTFDNSCFSTLNY